VRIHLFVLGLLHVDTHTYVGKLTGYFVIFCCKMLAFNHCQFATFTATFLFGRITY